MTPEDGARRLILRAFDRGIRIDIPFIAEVTGLPDAAVTDIADTIRAQRTQAPGRTLPGVTAPHVAPSPQAVGPAGPPYNHLNEHLNRIHAQLDRIEAQLHRIQARSRESER